MSVHKCCLTSANHNNYGGFQNRVFVFGIFLRNFQRDSKHWTLDFEYVLRRAPFVPRIVSYIRLLKYRLKTIKDAFRANCR